MFYALASNKEDWSDKLDAFIALAPTTRLSESNCHPAFDTTKYFNNNITSILKEFKN